MAVQRNVQQQNALTKEQMLRCAASLENNAQLSWLQRLLREHGLDPSKGALVSLVQIPDQSGTFYSGVWIGTDHRFWEFSGTVGSNPLSVVLESFRETTSQVAMTSHGRGTGSSFGQLAAEVLRERSEVVASNARHLRRASEA